MPDELMDIKERMTKLFSLRNKVKELDRAFKDVKAEYDFLRKDTVMLMQERGMLSMKDEEGRLACLGKDAVHAHIAEGATDAAMKWLMDNGYAYAVTPIVHHKTLSSIVKSRLEEGNDVPKELFGFYIDKQLSLRGGNNGTDSDD